MKSGIHSAQGSARTDWSAAGLKRNILIVEDDTMMKELYRAILGEQFLMRVVSSGEDAMTEVRGFTPDLIILDRVLPGMDGVEVCRAIRKNSMLDAAKIIMVSGESTLSERLEGFKAGADDFLTKPIQPVEFMAKVQSALNWTRKAMSSALAGAPALGVDRINCWDYKKCGRTDCPALIQRAGRLCWLVAGTMCGGQVSGSFSQKMKNCHECDFFELVRTSNRG